MTFSMTLKKFVCLLGAVQGTKMFSGRFRTTSHEDLTTYESYANPMHKTDADISCSRGRSATEGQHQKNRSWDGASVINFLSRQSFRFSGGSSSDSSNRSLMSDSNNCMSSELMSLASTADSHRSLQGIKEEDNDGDQRTTYNTFSLILTYNLQNSKFCQLLFNSILIQTTFKLNVV